MWAGETSRVVEHAVAAILPEGSSLRSLSCRSNLCRVELSHRDQAAAERFQDLAIMGDRLIWRGAMYWKREAAPDGTYAAVGYLARDGTEVL